MALPDIESLLSNHERVKALQSKTDDVQFSRMVLNIPREDQADNFTTGTLNNAACFASTPAIAVSRSQKTMIAIYYLGKGFTGHKGFVHGGATATIFDECSGRAAVTYFEAQKEGDATSRSAAVTAQLTVNYVAPIRTESCVMVQAEVLEEGLSKRKAKVTAKLWSLGDQEVLGASADSLFIEPKV